MKRPIVTPKPQEANAETAMLQRLSENCEVEITPPKIPAIFSTEGLLNCIKTITNEYATRRGIKPPYEQ